MRKKHCEVVSNVSHLNVDIQSVIRSKKSIKQWAYILHDKDDTEPHYHIYLNFGNTSVEFSDVGKWFGLDENFVNKIEGRKSDMLLYLTHGNDGQQHKHQYSPKEVIANFDFESEIAVSTVLGNFEEFSYVKSETSIYTKNLVECQGLEITPDFEATGTYQVFYYDTNKLFLGASPVLNASTGGTYKKGQDFPYAKYCRIMITPETPKDDDGLVIEDYKIKFYEVIGIADDFTITVNKEQKAVQNENLFDSSINETGCSYSVVEGLASIATTPDSNAVTVRLEGHVNYLKLDYDVAPGTYSYLFVDENNSVLSSGELNNETLSYNLIVPESAVLLVINYSPDSVPAIYRAG